MKRIILISIIIAAIIATFWFYFYKLKPNREILFTAEDGLNFTESELKGREQVERINKIYYVIYNGVNVSGVSLFPVNNTIQLPSTKEEAAALANKIFTMGIGIAAPNEQQKKLIQDLTTALARSGYKYFNGLAIKL